MEDVSKELIIKKKKKVTKELIEFWFKIKKKSIVEFE